MVYIMSSALFSPPSCTPASTVKRIVEERRLPKSFQSVLHPRKQIRSLEDILRISLKKKKKVSESFTLVSTDK